MLERDADDPLIERFCFIFRDDQTERRPIDRFPDKRQQTVIMHGFDGVSVFHFNRNPLVANRKNKI